MSFNRKKINKSETRKDKRIINLSQSVKHAEKLIKDRPKHARYALILVSGILLLFYLGWQLKQISQPPSLLIYNPSDDLVVKASQMIITGKVEKDSVLKVNNEIILPDSDGVFSQLVNLQPGVNTFVFEAKKRYGGKTEVIRHINYLAEPVVKGEKIIITN